VAPSLLRAMNQRFVLDWLYRHGPATRPQISRAIGLSQPTVFATLANLEDVGLVRMRGRSEDQTGRPALVYEVDARTSLVAAVDIGRDWMRVMVADLLGTILASNQVRRGTRPLVAAVSQAVAATVDEARAAYEDLTQVVIAAPGAYRAGDSRVRYAAQLPEWRHPHLFEEFVAALGTRVAIENDVNLAALAEHRLGAGQNMDPFVYLHIGAGVGLGLVVHGEVYRGFSGAAGEIGFLPLGRELPSGTRAGRNSGILEQELAAEAIVAQAAGLGLARATTAEKVFELARQGDPRAREVVSHQTEILAALLTSVSAFLDPEFIVVGGGIGQNLDLLGAGLVDRLDDLSPLHPRLVASTLGTEVTVRGAVTHGVELAREAVFAERMGVSSDA